jgi:glycosyltransferase involved in cell wall biosynthesis
MQRSCRLRILLLHNFYREPGGEDGVVLQEKALLEAKGHDVDLFSVTNKSFSGVVQTASIACGTVYSRKSRALLQGKINAFRPDLVHVHNFFPQLSPSIYYACGAARLPVVQTLHNFRLICPNALLFREGRPCEKCIGKSIAWPGVVNACYRNSHAGTAVVAATAGVHRISHTWSRAVHAYIALSNFARSKFIAGGVPAARLFVKPNFVMPDPAPGKRHGDFAIFVGRLSSEKGVTTLLSAWAKLSGRKLTIVGDGPLRSLVEQAHGSRIQFFGRQPGQRVLELLGAADFLVFPSECYENFPRVIAEAFARGTPVLGSDLGSTREILDAGRTGLLFRPGDDQDLSQKAEWLFTHPDELRAMSEAARRSFETNYCSDRNYDQLIHIYQAAITTCHQSSR